MTEQRTFNNFEKALKPYGYEWLLGIVGISGPGNLVVVFAGPGDFYVACVTHDSEVLWCLSCGGTREGFTDAALEAFQSATLACTGITVDKGASVNMEKT